MNKYSFYILTVFLLILGLILFFLNNEGIYLNNAWIMAFFASLFEFMMYQKEVNEESFEYINKNGRIRYEKLMQEVRKLKRDTCQGVM